ncbi:glycosyltransferase [Cephaloticoccus primus]|uniref:Glycosyltransferase n=1 Tax=Cephaloticoccus primus TaxID=1548207 RepID=A0A139ST44_9BACT|nr:glycosyltransferase [Cephaloticoccus primus]KXU37737.1 glycosyltransferase [Cephaloticoccus primus]
MSKLRILVLTSSTGGGHDARAEAFAEWCFELYRHQVDVRIEQMLEKSSWVARLGVNLYNWIQKKSPWMHKAFYAVVEGLSLINGRTVTLGRGYYLDVLRTYRPHLVFSVHDCLNRGYFQLARAVLGEGPAGRGGSGGRVRTATYCGEFSGGWGYSINWIEPTVDRYFSRTATANDYAVKKGIPRERTRVRGRLMRPREHHEVLMHDEREHFLSHQLGLRPGLFTVFLATGGNGANNHLALLPTLLRHASRCQVILICGRNREAYNTLIHWRANHPELRCHIEGYTDVMHLLLQVSDCVVTRGGTTTCAQALDHGCPIIFNAFGGIMPQEELTWKFFHNGAASPRIENAGDFEALIDHWMREPAAYRAVRDRFRAARYTEDPTLLIDELVALANEVCQAELTRYPWAEPPLSAARPGATAEALHQG